MSEHGGFDGGGFHDGGHAHDHGDADNGGDGPLDLEASRRWRPTRDEADLIRARQRSRSFVLGLLLAGLAVLVFLITLSRIRASLS